MSIKGKENILVYAKEKQQICKEIKEIVVEQLCLDMDPDFITADQPLFGRGLELDSIDSLELSVGIFNKYQISLSDDEKDVFSSVNTMADYILKKLGDKEQETPSFVDFSGGIDLG